MWRVISSLVILMALTGAARAGEAGAESHEAWRMLTRLDVQAAYRLLRENHPGAVPQVGDRAFTVSLARAHALALARAQRVSGYPGYLATLAAFAGAMGDGHIAVHPLYVPRELHWAGIIAARRGAGWVVASDDPRLTGAELKGARIISCDGRPVSRLARQVLGFHTTASVEALRVVYAGFLLIDDGNPFVHRPKSCLFRQAERDRRLRLDWTSIARATLIRRYWKLPVGEAGFGVRRSGAGYWIGIQQLTGKANAVLAAVHRQERSLRAAPYVVLDLRGDGGGDDSYGRRVAVDLYGARYVDSMLGPADTSASGCEEAYRASPGNIAGLTRAMAHFRKSGDTMGYEQYRAAVRRMKAALAAGRPFTGKLRCSARRPAPARAATSRMRGRVFVLTDAACFSSCINVVGFFRKLGAVQVGQETGYDTHYAEVRESLLPSGLAKFSTLQAIMPDYPLKIGPYRPAYAFSGDIADTRALEAWIARLAMAARRGGPATGAPAASPGA